MGEWPSYPPCQWVSPPFSSRVRSGLSSGPASGSRMGIGSPQAKRASTYPRKYGHPGPLAVDGLGRVRWDHWERSPVVQTGGHRRHRVGQQGRWAWVPCTVAASGRSPETRKEWGTKGWPQLLLEGSQQDPVELHTEVQELVACVLPSSGQQSGQKVQSSPLGDSPHTGPEPEAVIPARPAATHSFLWRRRREDTGPQRIRTTPSSKSTFCSGSFITLKCNSQTMTLCILKTNVY